MDLVTSSYLAANTTTVSPPTQVPNYVGFICLAVSVLFFGSNFLPIKAFDTGKISQINQKVIILRCSSI